MITDPLARWGAHASTTGGHLVDRALDDNIANDLMSKFIGLAICTASILALAGESEFTILSP
jgi:hypothetical protein